MRLAVFLFLAALTLQAQVRPVVPRSALSQPTRYYTPAIDAGDYVYISGQGPRTPEGALPTTFSTQVRQCLDNLKSIVEAAGLTMENVVYAQVYLEDVSKYDELNKVWAGYFPKTPPARAVLGVARV